MLDSKITTILFDLDGTLLPMEMESFITAYFGLLAKKAAEYGYTDAKAITDAVWGGTKAMIGNDGTKKNIERFWETFAGALGEEMLTLRPVFDRFYAEEFNGVKAAVGENPLAKPLIDALKARGYEVVLATSPLFPRVGVRTRLSWIGLTPEDFSEVTCYEDYSYCKPNPAYFAEVLQKIGKRPEECFVVGNDAEEDLCCMQQGISAYLVTDCLINRHDRPLSDVPHGSFREMMDFLGV